MTRATVALCACLSLLPQTPRTPPPAAWQPQASGVSVRLRGVSAVSPTIAWASGANGTVLRTTDGGRTWTARPVPGAERLDFRDVDAMSDRVAYALSIGPGESSRVYKTTDGGAAWTLQFENTDSKIFLDAMAFVDETQGYAFSDSVDGRLVILVTNNGGRSWERVADDRLPAALPGEGAFAASGTNVAVFGREHVWIGTSGSRVIRSTDGGRTWTASATPVATGPATGVFSIAFRDTLHGVVVGGNYREETAAVDNVAVTSDGGATWSLVRERALSGFRSVVAWAPALSDQSLVAIGPSGVDWSFDDGRSWTPAPGEGFDTVSLAPRASIGWAAGQGGRISKFTLTRRNVAPRRGG
jgi:photosystem II stability/assembly factor-like uncharacterized protein